MYALKQSSMFANYASQINISYAHTHKNTFFSLSKNVKNEVTLKKKKTPVKLEITNNHIKMFTLWLLIKKKNSNTRKI